MTDTALSAKIDTLVNSGKCMGLTMLAGTCQAAELEVIRHLPEGMGKLLPGSAFDKVWAALSSMGELTFFIGKDGNIFEIKLEVSPGKSAHGYFNLFAHGKLNGHLRPETVAHIALLKIPFLHLQSRQIAFVNAEGQVMYSFYLTRDDNKQLKAEQVQAFEALWAEAQAGE